jgi:hypothetical protein
VNLICEWVIIHPHVPDHHRAFVVSDCPVYVSCLVLGHELASSERLPQRSLQVKSKHDPMLVSTDILKTPHAQIGLLLAYPLGQPHVQSKLSELHLHMGTSKSGVCGTRGVFIWDSWLLQLGRRGKGLGKPVRYCNVISICTSSHCFLLTQFMLSTGG